MSIVPTGRRRITHPIGERLSTRHNSLNFLRLALALAVVAGHALGLGGFGFGFIADKTELGIVAVYGFFGISGYLIASSAQRNSVGRYLWQRALRIFPGFWVCLFVTAFGIALVSFVTDARSRHGHDLQWYLTSSQGAAAYVLKNLSLHMSQYAIAGTPSGIPVPARWDYSLWSLFFEFLCYLIIALLAVLNVLTRRVLLLGLTTGLWLLEFMFVVTRHPIANFYAFNLSILVPIFLTGSLLYLYRDVLPDSGLLAIGCMVVVLGSLWIPIGSLTPQAFFGPTAPTSFDLFAPVLVFPLLWLGMHLPLQQVGARNDFSYGIYIYAFPVQQLLAVWGAYRLGYWAYLGLGVAGTVPFALASWFLVERHALKLKRLGAPVRSTASRS